MALPSAGGAAGGAVVDSAALDAFAEKVTGSNGVLAATARFVLNELGVAAPAPEESEDENAAVVAAVEAELALTGLSRSLRASTPTRPSSSMIGGLPPAKTSPAPTTTTIRRPERQLHRPWQDHRRRSPVVRQRVGERGTQGRLPRRPAPRPSNRLRPTRTPPVTRMISPSSPA